MKTIERWKAWTFVGSLALVALVMNSTVGYRHRQYAAEQRDLSPRRHEEQLNAQTAAKAEAQAAAEHARFLARYLTRDRPAEGLGVMRVAIVVASENNTPNNTVAGVLANPFKAERIGTSTSVFKPEFISDGLFADVFAGSDEILRRLEFTNKLDAVVLARQQVQYVTNPSLENVLTANMRLDIATFSLPANTRRQTRTFTSVGVGFKQADARSLAEERLIKQLMNDTNMLLTR